MNGVAAPAAFGLLVTGGLAFPSIKMVRAFLQTRGTTENVEDRVFAQRVETYRAALESSVARESLDEDASFLAELRHRFAIGDEAHRVLLHYAKTAVISAREADAARTYERLRLLGEGGAGRTWLARDRVHDTIVVLKEPLGDWQEGRIHEAFLQEARAASRVRHPNVVRILDVVTDKMRPILVLEYAEGGSVADLIHARGTLPWREAAALTMGVLEGLEAIHQAGVLHRDIKPANVLLSRDGTPKIGDFGIAVNLSSGKTSILAEHGATRAGTLSYLAPEIRNGATLGDVRTDVYGTGAFLHECLFGAPPGAGLVVIDATQTPPRLASVLARSLAEKAEDRYPTARAFHHALREAMKG